jgi:3-oxoacyl-(acyl-carrier-protein) synthase
VAVSRVFATGFGAVSPAGWAAAPLLAALDSTQPIPCRPLPGSAGHAAMSARTVPTPTNRPAVLAHPRLRRASAISQYAAVAALEALAMDTAGHDTVQDPSRLGIIVGVHTGSMRYSIRFYGEALRDPSTASPVLFPETVFNAPASHIAAYLNGAPRTYTLVGDQTVFLQALAVGAQWLLEDRVDRCLVVSAEESDWLMAAALRNFAKTHVHSEGAGAVCLARHSNIATPDNAPVELERITSMHLYSGPNTKHVAARSMRAELPDCAEGELLCDSQTGVPAIDAAEIEAWRDWTGARESVRRITGEALSAATAWQCVRAIQAIRTRRVSSATVSVVGSNEASLGARWIAAL